MLVIDPAPEAKTVRIQSPFRFLHLWSAGKNDIGQGQQFAFAANQFGGRVAEKRELVHAIVNDGTLVQLTGERRYRHWIVKPLHRRFKLAARRSASTCSDNSAPLLVDPVAVFPTIGWHFHLQNNNIRVLGNFAQCLLRPLDPGARTGLSMKRTRCRCEKSRNELLRSLPNPVPTEMRMHHDRIIVAGRNFCGPFFFSMLCVKFEPGTTLRVWAPPESDVGVSLPAPRSVALIARRRRSARRELLSSISESSA